MGTGPAISCDPAHWTQLERQQFLEMSKTSFVLDGMEVDWAPWDRNEGRWQDRIAGTRLHVRTPDGQAGTVGQQVSKPMGCTESSDYGITELAHLWTIQPRAEQSGPVYRTDVGMRSVRRTAVRGAQDRWREADQGAHDNPGGKGGAVEERSGRKGQRVQHQPVYTSGGVVTVLVPPGLRRLLRFRFRLALAAVGSGPAPVHAWGFMGACDGDVVASFMASPRVAPDPDPGDAPPCGQPIQWPNFSAPLTAGRRPAN